MTALPGLVAVPSGPAFTVVLVCHVAAAVGGMVTVVAGVAAAARLLAARDRPVPPAVQKYFSPGRNWAGRVLWLVPALGAALLAMSGGRYTAGQGWVIGGLVLWAGAVGVCEGVVWPAERRLRRGDLGGVRSHAAVRDAALVCAAGSGVFVVLVSAMVVMVVKP